MCSNDNISKFKSFKAEKILIDLTSKIHMGLKFCDIHAEMFEILEYSVVQMGPFVKFPMQVKSWPQQGIPRAKEGRQVEHRQNSTG